MFSIFAAAMIWAVFGPSDSFSAWILVIYLGMTVYIIPTAFRSGGVEFLISTLMIILFGVLIFFFVKSSVAFLDYRGLQGGYVLRLID